MNVKLRLDQDGYVYADGVRLCRVMGGGELEFCDRNGLRSKERGTRLIRVKIVDLLEISLHPLDKSQEGDIMAGRRHNPSG